VWAFIITVFIAILGSIKGGSGLFGLPVLLAIHGLEVL
jgi:hypothetical protein